MSRGTVPTDSPAASGAASARPAPGLASAAIIVFAKAPLPGQAKTRLIPALGADGAAALAARLLEHTLQAAAAAGAATLELCGTPGGSPAALHPALRAAAARHGAVLTVQAEGDLGRRMARALHDRLATHRAAMVVGTDAPSLDATGLREAAAALVRADVVFVPALDGGYALLGLARPAPALFDDMPWSTPQVMALSRERCRAAGLRWVELAPVADIDEPADLVHLPPGWPEGVRPAPAGARREPTR